MTKKDRLFFIICIFFFICIFIFSKFNKDWQEWDNLMIEQSKKPDIQKICESYGYNSIQCDKANEKY